MPRKSYGVTLTLSGGGEETLLYPDRTTAERVRRTLRAWTGARDWQTQEALAELANDRPGKSAAEIIGEAIKAGIGNRR